jgi:hypothetical protein
MLKTEKNKPQINLEILGSVVENHTNNPNTRIIENKVKKRLEKIERNDFEITQHSIRLNITG